MRIGVCKGTSKACDVTHVSDVIMQDWHRGLRLIIFIVKKISNKKLLYRCSSELVG